MDGQRVRIRKRKVTKSFLYRRIGEAGRIELHFKSIRPKLFNALQPLFPPIGTKRYNS